MILPWKTMFLILLALGSFMAISAPSWMTAWMGLEMNMLAFLALSMNDKSPRSSEATLKYFLIQALASAIFISSAFLMSFFSWSLSNLNFFTILILLSLLIKIGAAPFHLWVPQILEGMKWINLLIVLIWQKLAPFILLSSCLETKESKTILTMSIFLSAIFGAITGLSQSSTRKLLAFSSINHVSWMLMALMFKMDIWFLYFVSYSLMLILLTVSIMTSNIPSLSSNSTFSSNPEKFALSISLLSFGGLPPLFGFGPKWLIISSSVFVSKTLILFMVLLSLITLFFYLRISFSFMMHKTNFSTKMFKQNSLVSPLIISVNFIGMFVSALLFIL